MGGRDDGRRSFFWVVFFLSFLFFRFFARGCFVVVCVFDSLLSGVAKQSVRLKREGKGYQEVLRANWIRGIEREEERRERERVKESGEEKTKEGKFCCPFRLASQSQLSGHEKK